MLAFFGLTKTEKEKKKQIQLVDLLSSLHEHSFDYGVTEKQFSNLTEGETIYQLNLIL